MARGSMKIKFLFNDFPDIRRKVGSETQKIALETAGDVKSDVVASMKSGGPSSPGQSPAIGEGELVGSFHTAPGKRHTAVVYSDDEKALHLEFGTKKMGRRPFMAPAMKKNKRKFLRKLRDLEKRLR